MKAHYNKETLELGGYYMDDYTLDVPEPFIEITQDEFGKAIKHKATHLNKSLKIILPDITELIEPTPQVPPKITMRQARLTLLKLGYLSQVDAYLDTLPSPQKESAKIEWEYASFVERHNELILIMQKVLSLSEKQVDDMFIEASKL